MSEHTIRFTVPRLTGNEKRYIETALASGHIAGDGPFTRSCHEWLQAQTGSARALLTHSCTAALEMAALLLDLAPGDEVIMPSYTFVSTANAVVLRGAVPVFVDVRPDTQNLDERLIEAAITPRTRAVIPVHYAGIACEMDAIQEIAARHGLAVIEDAAQGLMASYKGRALGSIGALAALSFHQTKNVVSGEGGALLVNDATLAHRAEVLREKGTDRSRFLRGQIDKYTWQDIGSSYLPSEILAAILLAQLEQAKEMTHSRLASWDRYHERLEPLERRERLRRPHVPEGVEHNGHIYYAILAENVDRERLIRHMAGKGIQAVFHYVALHTSPAGRRFGRAAGAMPHTLRAESRLLRLPLFAGLTEAELDHVVDTLLECLT